MIERLTPAELDHLRTSYRYAEYVEFLQGLRLGQGGRVVVADTGVSRQSVKNRLKSAASVAGVEIAFLRSSPDIVVFEVVSKK